MLDRFRVHGEKTPACEMRDLVSLQETGPPTCRRTEAAVAVGPAERAWRTAPADPGEEADMESLGAQTQSL